MISERQVALRGGGNFTTLTDLLDKREVNKLPFVNTQELTLAGVQFKLVNTDVLSGNLAVGTATATSGGIMSAALSGAVGTAATTAILDSFGNVLNLCHIRDASTLDNILDGDGRTVYGLFQSDSSVVDGTAIGDSGSDNCQLSFVVVGADGTFSLTSVTATIEFQVNKVVYLRNDPTIKMVGGNADTDIIAPNPVEPLVRKLVVTAEFAIGEVITLTTGAGSGTGTSTPSGDTTTLDTDAPTFNGNNLNRIRMNGVQLIRGIEVTWQSTNGLSFSDKLLVGDVIEIEIPNITA